jgi:chemotaxis signal transduction protein
MNQTSLSVSPNPETKSDRQQKLLIFQVGQLYLGLKIESVQKVLRYTSMQGSGTTDVGLININNQEITAIDLHKRLFNVSQSLLSSSNPFIILAKNSLQESFAIIVEQTPTLADIPVSNIRILPDSYRQADTLSMASHVTRIEEHDCVTTVFILEVDCLI